MLPPPRAVTAMHRRRSYRKEVSSDNEDDKSTPQIRASYHTAGLSSIYLAKRTRIVLLAKASAYLIGYDIKAVCLQVHGL